MTDMYGPEGVCLHLVNDLCVTQCCVFVYFFVWYIVTVCLDVSRCYFVYSFAMWAYIT